MLYPLSYERLEKSSAAVAAMAPYCNGAGRQGQIALYDAFLASGSA